ncbi:MAG: hypothetical protein IPL31_05785 [Saprospiraceae bacterium]|nr:hypothetical protein [Saprospiraceae bacterium]
MNNHEQKYLIKRKQIVYDRISELITENNIAQIVKINLIESNTKNKSVGFQEYYFSILNKEIFFLESKDFFKRFNHEFALRTDNFFLNELEKDKIEILKIIKEDRIDELYFDTFFRAKSKSKNGFKEKELGSFFTKLVHVFRPDDYCALDNPIKNYFGLKKEGFFIAFLIISSQYKHWTLQNAYIVKKIRDIFKDNYKSEMNIHDGLTDLKLLDLIFWNKVNLSDKKAGR